MKIVFVLLLAATLASAQQPHKSSPPQAHPAETQAQTADMNAVWQSELPNMKSDLAERRSMLNVMASQESSLDLRSSGAFQTNRRMWQVVIARLAELTQRMDALERSQGQQPPSPRPEQP